MTSIFVTTVRHGLDGKRPTPLDGGLFRIEESHVGRLDPVFGA